MWRHGDVLVAVVDAIPEGAKKEKDANPVLAYGEITGHSHRIAEPNAAELWEKDGEKFLKVVADNATLIHEEHKPITLPRGVYKVWQQREYSPREVRRVFD